MVQKKDYWFSTKKLWFSPVMRTKTLNIRLLLLIEEKEKHRNNIKTTLQHIKIPLIFDDDDYHKMVTYTDFDM